MDRQIASLTRDVTVVFILYLRCSYVITVFIEMSMLIFIAIASVLLYLYARAPFSYWKKLHVPHLKPHFLWGNLKDAIYQKRTLFEVYANIYKRFRNAPYVGIYIARRPGVLIRDPELIKKIVQTDFASFHNNDLLIDESTDPIFAGNPFTCLDERWKTRRAMHTPQFSSGKIKQMFNLINQGGDRMIRFINEQIDSKGECTVEGMELAAKYTIYNVANITMGIDPKTFDEENSEMRDMGRKILEPSFFNGMKQVLIFVAPWLSRFLSISLIPKEVTNKFRNMVKENLQYRKENSIVRNDFFEDVQEYKGEKNSLDEMVVQIGGFYLDAFGTNSTSLTFILYELARNPDVQERLREEADKYLGKHNGEISYEVFQEMPYLDAFISESLRMYPPLPLLSKLCTAKYTLPPIGELGKSVTIEPNTPVIIPLVGIHYDEKYFPDPERFDPTRFLGENKDKIEKFAYLPFNEGPRACLGKRFALVQTKMMILKLVSKFEVRLSKKTVTPIQFDKQAFLLVAEGGVWLEVSRRKN